MISARFALSSFLCVLQLTAGAIPFAAAASSFTYATPTSDRPGIFSGEAPIDRIGKIVLPKGLANFSNDELIVRAVPQWLFDRNIVLKGVIIRAEGVQQNGGFSIAGLAFVLDGLWMAELGKPGVESIDTIDGGKFSGRITGKTADSLLIESNDGKTQAVSFSKIKTIESVRALTFNIAADSVKINATDSSMSFDARELSLKSSQSRRSLLARNHVPNSNLKGTEAGISNTALATFLALDMVSTIAPAIAIPLVINAKNQRAAKNEIAKIGFQNFVNNLQSNSGPGSSTPTPSSSP